MEWGDEAREWVPRLLLITPGRSAPAGWLARRQNRPSRGTGNRSVHSVTLFVPEKHSG